MNAVIIYIFGKKYSYVKITKILTIMIRIMLRLTEINCKHNSVLTNLKLGIRVGTNGLVSSLAFLFRVEG